MIRKPNRKLRLLIIMASLALFATIIVIRLALLMLRGNVEGEVANSTVERGSILDRNGRILAIQMQFDSVTAWTPDIEDPQQLAVQLAPIIDQEVAALAGRLQSASGFILLKRQASLTEAREIRQLIDAGELRGISLQKSAGRVYPEQTLAAPLIGYIGIDNIGLAGIEYSFDQQLSTSSENSSSQYGNHIFLTIDINLQYFAEELAARALREERADRVMLVIMQPASGELLASVSLPSFDPNNFSSASESQRKNHVVASIYEPGSVFKIFSVATLLEQNAINHNTRFNTNLGYSGVDEQYQIGDVGEYGIIDVEGVIKFSSNIGAALASDYIDPERFYHTLVALGFGERTEIVLSGEERGLFRDVQEWTDRTKPTIAIGQEIGVTALQMVTAASAIANRGVMVRPQVVKRIVSANGELLMEYGRNEWRQPLSAETAQQMLQLMQGATQPGGTARRVAIEGINIAAKTGTAEVYDTETERYSDTHFVASTLAIFPVEEPQFIVYAIIDNPQGQNIFGGQIVAPRIREMIEYIVSYVGIEDEGQAIVYDRSLAEGLPTIPALEDVIPNFIGLPKRSLVPLLQQSALTVEIEGSGWVVRQFPAPGTPIDTNTIIYLELE